MDYSGVPSPLENVTQVTRPGFNPVPDLNGVTISHMHATTQIAKGASILIVVRSVQTMKLTAVIL